MALFKIAEGPWEKLFSGNFQEHEVELYSNPDKILMVLVYEKKLDRIEGAIVELYKVFSASGEVESFTETLPRDVLILTKHDENSTLKFLLLGSKPTYVRWTEKEFVKETDSLVKRLLTSSKMIKDVSKAYELNLEEIAASSQEVQTAFFTQPMLVPMLASSSHTMPGEQSEGTEFRTITKGDIVVGLTRDKKRIVEPLALFTKTLVNEGDEKDRNRVIQIIGESALLSNVPAVFFDADESFSGIGEKSADADAIQKYDVQVDPLGFPMKAMSPGKEFGIDVNLMSPEAIAEAFGVGDKDFARIVREKLGKEEYQSLEGLAEAIVSAGHTEEFSEFAVHKCARILKLISIRYPKLFRGSNDAGEMLKKGTNNIARACVLNVRGGDGRSSVLLTHSALRGITEFLRGSKESKQLGGMVFIPNAELIAPLGKQKKLSAEIYMMLLEITKHGGGFVLGSQKKIDIAQVARESAEATVNIVSGNDIGVQLKNRKGYRILARPTLSRQKQ